MMDTYIVNFDETKEGVYAISLVENPAIEVDFIALSKQETIQMASVDEEKRLLISPVLIPDKAILRVDDFGNPYNIVFPAETIRQAQQNFYKQGYQSNSTLEHDQSMKLSDVTFVESWIIEDEVHDKSVKYGFNLPVGTWMSIMKVDSDEVWAKVKSGEVKGFSIDGVFDIEQLKMSKNMNYENLKLWLSDTFGLTEKTDGPEVKETEGTEGEAQVELAAEFFYEGELAEGVAIFSDAEMTMPVADGEYAIEDKMVVVAEGKVVSVQDKPAEEDQPTQDVEVEVEMAFDPEAKAMELETKIAELDAKIVAIDELLKANNIAMSKMIAEGFEKLIQDGEEVEETEKPVQLTKAMPSVDVVAEPKNAKERILNKIKNLK